MEPDRRWPTFKLAIDISNRHVVDVPGFFVLSCLKHCGESLNGSYLCDDSHEAQERSTTNS
jgi:hypothetical protein